MKLIKSIVRPNKVDEVKDALEKLNISGMTVTEVRGHGKQKGHTAIYRGKEYNVSLLPKMEIEVVVPDAIADDAIKAIIAGGAHRRDRRRPRVRAAGAESYRIRTGEKESISPDSRSGCQRSIAGGLASESRWRWALLVPQGFDRIEARRANGRHHAEEDADGGREAEADRERPPRQRDGEAGGEVHRRRRCRCRSRMPRTPPTDVSTAASARN